METTVRVATLRSALPALVGLSWIVVIIARLASPSMEPIARPATQHNAYLAKADSS